jgi:hypothetical protein
VHRVIDEPMRLADQRVRCLDRPVVPVLAVQLVVLLRRPQRLVAPRAGEPPRTIALDQIEVLSDPADDR